MFYVDGFSADPNDEFFGAPNDDMFGDAHELEFYEVLDSIQDIGFASEASFEVSSGCWSGGFEEEM